MYSEKMARLEGPTSNTIFEVLAEWETYLKSEESEFHSLLTNCFSDNDKSATDSCQETCSRPVCDKVQRGPSP